MDNKQIFINEMNKFLKGVHMGATTFKDYLEKAQSPELREALIEIIKSFKRHEEIITHKIDEMGGNAADSVGVMGMMGEVFEKMKLMVADTDEKILKNAINAVEMGIKNGYKFIEENGNLVPSLMKEVKEVVSEYDNHLRKLKSLNL